MLNHVLVFTEEGLKRVVAALGEQPAKMVHEVLKDIETQLTDAEKDVTKYVAMVKQHLAPHEAKIPVTPPLPAVPGAQV